MKGTILLFAVAFTAISLVNDTLTVDATNNYWQTTDSTEINCFISGDVDFSPWSQQEY